MFVSLLALLNGYFHFYTTASYSVSSLGITSPYAVAGYFGMFLTIFISPIPDYVLVPVYGYLSSIGVFNPLVTFLVCLLGAVLPIEYLSGKYAARTLLLKALAFIHISEKDLEVADTWIENHGHFSIFIATFIPFFYSASALAAGTLKMSSAIFYLSSIGGFGLRFLFLEYVGFYGIYVFTATFDYSLRSVFVLLLILSSIFAGFYLIYFQRLQPIPGH